MALALFICLCDFIKHPAWIGGVFLWQENLSKVDCSNAELIWYENDLILV